MERRKKVIDRVGAFVRDHDQQRIASLLALIVVHIDGHAVIAPGLGQHVAEDVDGIDGVPSARGAVPFAGQDVHEAVYLVVADGLFRHGHRLRP